MDTGINKGGNMWVVMIGSKSGYSAHSFHDSEERARQWKECMEYNGEYVAVCKITDDQFEEATDLYSKRHSNSNGE